MTKQQIFGLVVAGAVVAAVGVYAVGEWPAKQEEKIAIDKSIVLKEDKLMGALLDKVYGSVHANETDYQIFADYQILEQTAQTTYVWAVIQSFYVKDGRLLTDSGAVGPYRIDYNAQGEIVEVTGPDWTAGSEETILNDFLSESAAQAAAQVDINAMLAAQNKRVDEHYTYLGDVTRYSE